ncbi:tripartite tricarboxylate transporter substrate-binding protein [Falsiroseomonas selenitidurans]|uniref:Tripartite tricarboxylate transporter substrate binding protein n=1 Tax=Falsiroseomonas selenitidurans TaxID=2716335 RepID=A0ABX1EE92_9PROT|nr:tripartite tricarboxylate transporter substrate-binding protein [Falsiroseomonas selenitidurans]NKC34227.1 tripartite tricarboxylate transporter substrate binding protein [Falsiroseomonas selenitidurans]
MTHPTRRSTLMGLAALATAGTAQAQAPGDYPNRPIRVVVPSPPGGPPDLIVRILAPRLAAALGQPVVIENRPGAGGVIGSAFVARQPADGYTWLFTTASHVNTPPFNPNVNFDPIGDFTHVTLAVQNFGQALVINPGVAATNLAELTALAKRDPGKLTYANAGNGTASHIPAELYKSMAGVDILSIPYRGVAEAVADLLAGRVDMFFVGTNVAVGHVRAGRLRAIALTGARRWKGMPEVPTMQEAGLAGYDTVNWFGCWMPAGAPPAIVAKVHAAMAGAVNAPEVVQQFDAQGLQGIALPPERFVEFIRAQAAQAQEIGRRVNR